MNQTGLNLLAVVGPTASGKTRRAVDLAMAFDGEIISADSRQVYRGMDLGTGKDIDEYGTVPVHLLDVVPAGYKYNLYEYLRDYRVVCDLVLSHGALPVVCGGTGMYVEAVLNGLLLPEVPRNEELRKSLANKSLAELTEILSTMKRLHNTTDVDTVQRAMRAIEIETYYAEHPDEAIAAKPRKVERALVIGVDISRDDRRSRISNRLQARLEQGMIEEVEGLLKTVAADDLIYYGLEYKFITLYLLGKLSKDRMIEGLETAIHQFAKRQMTWLRGMERRGHKIHWLPYDLPGDIFIDHVQELIPSVLCD